jgi:hypothetical protein
MRIDPEILCNEGVMCHELWLLRVQVNGHTYVSAQAELLCMAVLGILGLCLCVIQDVS